MVSRNGLHTAATLLNSTRHPSPLLDIAIAIVITVDAS